jgi:hypothetical protein
MRKGQSARLQKLKLWSSRLGRSIKFFLSVNWIYRTDEEYFLLNFFENNHKCVPFGLLITKKNLLLLLIFFLSLAVFRFILKKLPFKWYKIPTMLLEKVSIHTEILFVHCYKFFFIITCSFSVFVENCILLPKCINEFVVFLCIVHVWFWFFTLLPIFLLLVIKGQFFPRTQILFQSAFFFSYKNVASKSFYKSRIHPFPLMLMQRNEMWYTYTPLGI